MLHVLPFDEADYLTANPDVRAAVDHGVVGSGAEHYELYGRREGRPLRTRSAWLRRGLDLRQRRGLEIGPLCRPTVQKSEGAILYVDFTNREQLAARYARDPDVDVEALVDVDIIWAGGSLLEAMGASGPVDYVLASHVAEHVPDLVSWLAELASVLTPGGRVRLVVPDRRFTFDRYRVETQLPDVLDAYVRLARVPQPRQILDFMLFARPVDLASAWQGNVGSTDSTPAMATVADAVSAARDALEHGTYHDTHCWVFTPRSFAALLHDLTQFGFLSLACRQLLPTTRNGFEFFVELVVSDDMSHAAKSWEEALAVAEAADARFE